MAATGVLGGESTLAGTLLFTQSGDDWVLPLPGRAFDFAAEPRICRFVFQTLSDSVISLDLTKIIAFDASRERKRSMHLPRCRVLEVGWNECCVHVGKKAQGLPE
jgi:hypothetical protein